MKYVPYRHQTLAREFLLAHDHCALFLGMGLGKTVTTLSVLAERLFDTFTVRRCLVIAPKNVAENVWAQECQKWEHLQDIRCSQILGTEKQRRAALEKEADLYIISRENVVWLMDALHGALPFEMVILDELSSFKSQKAKRWRALRKPIQKVPYVIGLTGTPAPNGYLDLFPQIYLLDGGQRLGKRIGEYRDRYFSPGAHKNHIVYEWRLRVGARDAINRKLQDLCLSMSSEDWLDLPPVIYNEIPVSMDEAARKKYDRLQKEKIIPLLRTAEDCTVLDPTNPEDLDKMTAAIRGDTAAVITGKLLQMANGAVYDDAGGLWEIHDAKLDALAEIAEACPEESLLVFYSYRHDLTRLQRRFPEARVLSGPEEVERWNAGKTPMLLCHAASAGHGLNLQQGGHITVWFGLTWSLELYQQANARLLRPGQKERVIIHHLLCRDTVDERVMQLLKRKRDGQEALLGALRQYFTGKEAEGDAKLV